MMKHEEYLPRLKEAKQEHLLQYLDQCSEEEKSALLKDIASIDFRSLQANITKALASNGGCSEGVDEPELRQIPSNDRRSWDSSTPEERRLYRQKGLQAIAEGRVGVILLAGGQGTRLGVSYPKGMYDIGLPSRKSLFQIQMERIKRLQSLSGSGSSIPLYVMTSSHTLSPTQEFFSKHDYFGLNPKDVFFFEQEMVPCFDFEGKVILESRSKISRAPNGNGGLYAALRNENILGDMRGRGIAYLHVYCVDNILVKVADPVFMGYCISSGVDAGNKVVKKEDPTEAVGVVCLLGGKYSVIEYSEISKENAELRDDSTGELKYNAGNICNHFFTLSFLERICSNDDLILKQHNAKKKIQFYDGVTRVKPTSPNGIKLEMFVFDVFEFTDRLGVWDVKREDEISPLKNSDSAPSNNPSSAREDVYRLHRRLIQNAGGSFENDGPVEISPLVSYDGEGLEDLVKGKTFTCPLELK